MPVKIGLFFGSFNPIHTGHLIIANYMIEITDLKKIWFVISPQNPFKNKANLLNEYDRLHLVDLAIGDNDKLESCNVEFSLPRPSYTIDTLTYLRDKHPDHHFCLIMGSDNLLSFHKWKNYEQILKHYEIYVYRRPGYDDHDLGNHHHVHLLDVPLLQISATFIRKAVKEGRSIRYFVPEAVYGYIKEMNYYK